MLRIDCPRVIVSCYTEPQLCILFYPGIFTLFCTQFLFYSSKFLKTWYRRLLINHLSWNLSGIIYIWMTFFSVFIYKIFHVFQFFVWEVNSLIGKLFVVIVKLREVKFFLWSKLEQKRKLSKNDHEFSQSNIVLVTIEFCN